MDPEAVVLAVNSIEAINARAKEIRKAIEDFSHKLNYEQASLTWPSVLGNFALLSGQVSSLLGTIKSDKTQLRNFPIVPLRLLPDVDPHLQTLTEGRVSIMSHAEVPDYLRTKPDPEVEQAERQLAADAAAHAEQTSISNAQLLQFNKQCNKVLDKIKAAQSSWRADQVISRSAGPSTFTPRATQELVAAVYYGHGLKMVPTSGPNTSTMQ